MSVVHKRLSRSAKNAGLDSIVNIASFSDEHVEDIWILVDIILHSQTTKRIKTQAQLDELNMEEKYTLYQAAFKAFNENDWSSFRNHPTIKAWATPYVDDAKTSFLEHVNRWLSRDARRKSNEKSLMKPLYGYPPSDSDLRKFLSETSLDLLDVLFYYFLAALFRSARKFLDHLTQTQEAMTYPEAAFAFREHMQGSEFDKAGPNRQAFYENVINDVKNNFEESKRLATKNLSTEATQAASSELKSLVYKLANYTRIPPFTNLGFDQIVKTSKANKKSTLDGVSAISFMAKLGRPLFGTRLEHTMEEELVIFATKKLLKIGLGGQLGKPQQLACVSRRLPIDFYMTSPASQEEEEQVEGHLRVCLHIDIAARLTYRKSSPALLAHVLHGFSVNQGDRGEFIVMQLILDARDAAVYLQEDKPNDNDNMPEDGAGDNDKLREDESDDDDDDDDDDDVRGEESDNDNDNDNDLRGDEPDDNKRLRDAKAQLSKEIDWLSIRLRPPSLTFGVCDFLSNLFHLNLSCVLPSHSHPKHQGQTLGTLLKHAKMNFNHFVKVHEFAAIKNRYLPAAMARSAALLCTNNQLGIDALTLFTYDDSSTIHPQNIGAILWQFKNTSKCTARVNCSLFDIMDPIKLGILA
ncbi:hypothetical protein C0995_011963 [Termitomyces sp. Mi166|nr:hypothetical protein C0995_011963 [Termitomyces sp. Mi166\